MSTLKTNNIQHVDRSDPSIIINTDGSVNIAGTMTYEDVTNVDAVGIITGRSLINAQKQVHVGTGVSVKAGGINVTAGITTVQALQATTGTFSGDLTIAENIVHSGDTNTLIKFPAADTVTVETGGSERFRIDSSGFMGLGTNSPTDTGGYGQALDITGGSGGAAIYLRASNGDTGQIALGSADLTIRTRQADPIIFNTDNSERLRITSTGTVGIATATPAGKLDVHGSGSGAIIRARRLDGNGGYNLFEGYSDVNAASIFYVSNNGLGYFKQRINIGTTTEGQASADDLTIATSGNTGITIRSGTSSAGNIYFSDATSGTAEYAGYVSYSHSTNALSFGTNVGTERLTIGSNGLVTITAETYSALTINTVNDGSNGPEIDIMHTSTSPAAGDVVGQLRYSGKDSAGNTTLYSKIETKVDDPTNGQETANIDFSTRGLASYNSIFRLKNRGTASAPSYTTDDINGLIFDVYNGGNPYPRYMSLIAKSAGDTESNISFWTESVGGSPTEKARITHSGTLYSGGGTIPSDLATYASSYRGREGVFGPIYYWPRVYGAHSNGGGYDDVAEGSRLTLRMYGATGGTNAMFTGSFDFGYGSAGEAKSYNRVRVIFRTTRANTTDGYNANTITFKMQKYYYSGGWSDISNSSWNFNGTDSERGYRWTASNWISSSDFANGFDVPSIAIKYDTDNGNLGNSAIRIAAVYLQYAYFN